MVNEHSELIFNAASPSVGTFRTEPSSGRGKRGGSRVIYYHFTADARIALLLIYPKNQQDDLTDDQRKALKGLIEHWR